MTRPKPKGTKKGSLPGMVGRAARRAGIVPPDGVARTFLGESPAVPERAAPDPEWEAEVRQVIEDLPGDNLREKARDMRFLAMIAPGEGQMSLTAAWKRLHPTATMKSAAESASRRYKVIRRAIGDKGVLALWGVHVGSIAKTLSDAQRAMFVRQFITRDGTVVTAPALVDHNVRLQAATLAMKLLGKGKDSEAATAPIVIQITQYADPRTAEPWKGGGRVVSGVLVNTVGRAALPPADFSDRKSERED